MSREDEMRRGAEIAARWAEREKAARPDEAIEARREIIRRWEEGRKVNIVRSAPRAEAFSEIDIIHDRRAIVNGVDVAIERYGPSWPSEQYVAQIALAIGAMAGFDGVPDMSSVKRGQDEARARYLQERVRRDEYRARQSWWKDHFDAGK